MNKGKTMVILVLIIIGIIGVMLNRGEEEPKEVITDDIETNETKIVLYFSNNETGELAKEYRLVDINNIKNDMPTTIISELLKGPNLDELSSTIPKDTKLNSITQDKNKITVDFSKEFGDTNNDDLKNLNKIYSVVNTLTEITEVNEVEIKVDGNTITQKARL